MDMQKVEVLCPRKLDKILLTNLQHLVCLSLRFNVLEVQETFFDRKDHVLECLDSVKTSPNKPILFGEVDSTVQEGSSSGKFINFDPATAEILLDLGRALYKLMFQLLLLIESNHKIAISVINNLKQNDKMQDISDLYLTVRGALLRCIDDAEMESLDTSTSTEGESTPTPSPGLPEMIQNQKWSAAISHTSQYKRVYQMTSSNLNLASSVFGQFDARTSDELSLILNIYSQKMIKDRSDAFILSKTDTELLEVYTILSENLCHVSSVLTAMEINMKSYSGISSIANKEERYLMLSMLTKLIQASHIPETSYYLNLMTIYNLLDYMILYSKYFWLQEIHTTCLFFFFYLLFRTFQGFSLCKTLIVYWQKSIMII